MTREEAKNWLKKLYMRTDITDEYGDMEDMQPYEEAVDIAIKALDEEPHAEKYKWLVHNKGCAMEYYTCSKCGKPSEYKSNYCPNCGADMRGEK